VSGISGPGTDQRAEPHVRMHLRRLEPGPGLAPPAIPGRQDRDDLRPGQRLPDRHESHRRTHLAERSVLARATATETVVRVFRDRASGLREGRLGLEKLLAATADGQVTVVRVTHEDRLARSGAGRLLAGSDRHPPGRAR